MTTNPPCGALVFCFVFILYLATAFHASAQAEFLIRGKVLDKADQSPIAFVNILNTADGNGATTSLDGSFEINVKTLPTSLRFSFVGFESKTLPIVAKSETPITVALVRSTGSLPEIVVTTEAKKIELTKPEFNIMDFILYKDKILLLKMTDDRSPIVLALTDTDGNIEQELPLTGIKKLESLHKGCLGEPYIIANMAYEIYFDDTGKMALTEGIPKDEFNTVVIPCVMATDSQVYYMHSYYEGQLVEFAMFHRTAKKKSILYRVVNEKNIKLLYSDFLLDDGGFADVVIEDWRSMRSFRNAQADRLATLNMFYQPLYTPLFDTGSGLCFLNHFERKAEFFNYDGKYQRYISLTHQNDKKWAKYMLNDASSHISYVVFNHPLGKSFQAFNYEDGSLGQEVVVETEFVTRMAVHAGNLFFLEAGTGGNRSNVNKKLRKFRISPF